jgi:S-adenosylmethionine-dependent methyltransferase
VKNTLRRLLLTPPVPKPLARRFRTLDPAGRERIQACLRDHYYADRAPGFLDGDAGRNALHDHTLGRLEVDRVWVIPWLDATCALEGLRVLEVGCGTGSSTVAIAEQGATVTALEPHRPSLTVARERLSVYGLDVEFVEGNATEIQTLFSGRTFDFILFHACIEHMTHEERMISMRTTWESLSPGGLWGLTETPNRLWYFDDHSSRLPLYQWLPDDLAIRYAQFSPRADFRDRFHEPTPEEMHAFYRYGRGVSFHEFDLTIGPVRDLRIVSCRRLFHRGQRPMRWWKRRWTKAGRFERTLTALCPDVPRPFLLPSLDLVLRK